MLLDRLEVKAPLHFVETQTQQIWQLHDCPPCLQSPCHFRLCHQTTSATAPFVTTASYYDWQPQEVSKSAMWLKQQRAVLECYLRTFTYNTNTSLFDPVQYPLTDNKSDFP